MKQPAFTRYFLSHWQQILIAIGFLTGFGVIGGWRLGTAVPTFSPDESAYIAGAKSLQQIADNPSYAPHKLVVLLLHETYHVSPVTLRVISVVFGAMAVVFFYLILKSWFTRRMAILGSILFACSSWFLGFARNGIPDITIIWGGILILLAGWQLYGSQGKFLRTLAWIAALALCVYIPGMLWALLFYIGIAFSKRKKILPPFNPGQVIILGAILLVIISPLAYALFRTPKIILQLLLLPSQVPNFFDLINNIVSTALMISVRSPIEPLYNIASLPKLDYATTVLLLLGVYYFMQKFRLRRTWALLFSMLLGLLLGGMAGATGRSTTFLILPSYIIATAGLTVLAQQWITVFPRNPIARFLGISALTVLMAVIALYHLDKYFLAWPNSDATKKAYQVSVLK